MATPKIITIALACLLAGCESMSPYETAWQTMHLVDVAQTLNGPASDPCYRESGLLTRHLIGEQPEPAVVIAWGIGSAVVHYFAWQWIDDSDLPDGWKASLRVINIANKGFAIASNHAIGIRPFGDNNCPWRAR